MNTPELRKTPLHARHLEAGARMVDFAGFHMPVQYSGVVQEHQAVRNAVGLFDVSHMGEVELRGAKAAEVADRIVTNHVANLEDGQACYTCMCRPDGGIVDDLVVYKISNEHVLICVNAANREKDFEYMQSIAGAECFIEDTGDAWAQIAVQGPRAAELVAKLTPLDLSAIRTYRFAFGEVTGVTGLVARTGYTGEDGFELYVPSAQAPKVWDALCEEGRELGVTPAGLGSRDSLRLEMCYPLYGNDIDETTNPYEAGLGWVVKLKKPVEFSGQQTLAKVKSKGVGRKLAPLQLVGRGIARAGYPIIDPTTGKNVGHVTSGTQGPSVKQAIALAYVPVELAKQGTILSVEVRGKPVEARVVERPFFKRSAE